MPDIAARQQHFEQAGIESAQGPGREKDRLTTFVLLIKAISPGGKFTKQFFNETKVTSARTAGAIMPREAVIQILLVNRSAHTG